MSSTALVAPVVLATAILALAPVAAQAASDNWTGATNNLWGTSTNWSGGLPVSTSSQAVIGVTTNNPVQLNINQSLNGGTGVNAASLTINSGSSLNIESGFTLTMGSHAITLNGGSITSAGTGAVSGGTIQGHGTFSALDTSATFSANSASGALTLNGGNTYSGTFNSSGGGVMDLGSGAGNGVTVSGSFGGSSGTYNLNNALINSSTNNNVNGTFNVMGDSTLNGAFTGNQYFVFNIGGANGAHTLNLTSASISTTGGTGGPTAFSIGAGGDLNNLSASASSIGGQTPLNMSGGSITTSAGAGLFTVNETIKGNGTISGNVELFSVTASGGTLTVNGNSASPLQLGNGGTGASFSTSGGATFDLQGNMTLNSGANANPGTGTVQFDGVTLSNSNMNNNGSSTSGLFKVASGTNTFNNLAFSTGTGATLQVNSRLNLTNGASLNVPATATINSGGTVADYNGAAAISGGTWNVNSGGLLTNASGTGTGGATAGALSANVTTLNVNAGGSVTNSSTGGIAATVGTLNLNGGQLTNSSGTGAVTVTVKTDYTNADWSTHSGNSFNPDANVTGAVIDAAGTGPFQTITGAHVSNGGTTTPTLAFGNVHVGATDSFAIKNTGTNDPSLRGAVQTTGLTGGVVSLAGGDQNFGPISTGVSTSPYTLTAHTAGSLSGQSVAVVSNFANVPTQTVGLTGTAWNLASGNLSPGSQNLGAFHVADPSQSLAGSNANGSITATNTAPAAFSEKLDVTGTTVTGNFATPTPYPTLIAPGGGTGTISVQTSGGVAGVNNGTVQASLQSDGLGTSGLGTTPLAPSNTVNVSATGYAYAAATTSTGSVDLGAFHVGGADPASKSFTVANSGPATGGYTEALDVTSTASGAGFSASPSPIDGIVQGASGTVGVSLTGGHVGANNGSVALGLTSNGTEIGDGLGTTPLAGQSVSVKAEGYHYADPVWSQTGGAGSFSGSGDAYTLDLGTLRNGVNATADLQILNQLYADDPTGVFTDSLDGSFTTQVVSGKAFDLLGFVAFPGVAPGNAHDQSVSYDWSGGPYGMYEEIITFAPTSFDTPLGDSNLSAITLTVTADVVPEASTYAMLSLGFAGLGFVGFGRKTKAPRLAAI